MIIEKVINNNVISALNDQNREVVIMGRGIGFKKKTGDAVSESQIEKIFVLSNEDETGRFAELLKSLPVEHLKVSTDIIDYANLVMQGRLSPGIYITLTDHINFALNRYEQGMMFENALLQEIRTFYPSEYLIGEYAISLIKKQLGVLLPVDEAASIALHFVNAEYNAGMGATMKITTLIRDVVELVQQELDIKLDEMGLYYSRFVTHLKFLSQRVFLGKQLDSQEMDFSDMVTRMYPVEYACSKRVGKYIEERYGQKVTDEELSYLTVHIRRIRPDLDAGKGENHV